MAQSHHADIQFLIILKLIRESLYLFVYFLEGGGGGGTTLFPREI